MDNNLLDSSKRTVTLSLKSMPSIPICIFQSSGAHMTLKVWHSVILSVVAVGCTKPLADPATNAKPANGPPLSPRTIRQRFDFGPVLTGGDALRHEFTIDNPSAIPIKIVRSTPLTPCCSSIEKYPETIPPFGTLAIPVHLNPARLSGTKSISFLIETDQLSHANYLLELSAELLPEWEVLPSPGNPRSFSLGMKGLLEFTVICRRDGDTGLSSPDSIKVSSPLKLRSDVLDSDQNQIQTGTFAEFKRRISIDIPPASHVGLNRGTLQFRWAEGTIREHDFGWQVTPAIQATPSIIIFNGTDDIEARSIALSSDQLPFRVTGVVCNSLLEKPRISPTADRVHKIELKIDRSRIDAYRQDGEILIQTDHPVHQEVIIKFLDTSRSERSLKP